MPTSVHDKREGKEINLQRLVLYMKKKRAKEVNLHNIEMPLKMFI